VGSIRPRTWRLKPRDARQNQHAYGADQAPYNAQSSWNDTVTGRPLGDAAGAYPYQYQQPWGWYYYHPYITAEGQQVYYPIYHDPQAAIAADAHPPYSASASMPYLPPPAAALRAPPPSTPSRRRSTADLQRTPSRRTSTESMQRSKTLAPWRRDTAFFHEPEPSDSRRGDRKTTTVRSQYAGYNWQFTKQTGWVLQLAIQPRMADRLSATQRIPITTQLQPELAPTAQQPVPWPSNQLLRALYVNRKLDWELPVSCLAIAWTGR
jgi:hypothetical protein